MCKNWRKGYVLNASLSPTIHSCWQTAFSSPEQPAGIQQTHRNYRGREAPPASTLRYNFTSPGPSSCCRLAGQSPEAVAGLWAAVLWWGCVVGEQLSWGDTVQSVCSLAHLCMVQTDSLSVHFLQQLLKYSKSLLRGENLWGWFRANCLAMLFLRGTLAQNSQASKRTSCDFFLDWHCSKCITSKHFITWDIFLRYILRQSQKIHKISCSCSHHRVMESWVASNGTESG